MSPQNIAIVMAPNLLWCRETGDGDYLSKVNSTASVNTVVEAMVSDWSYYFGTDDEFTVNDFYVTMNRDDLFPQNGGFPVDRDIDAMMTKSLNITTSQINNHGNNHHHLNDSSMGSINSSYQTHSRSSSHDTSLILIESDAVGGSTDSLTKRSQSNSSLSDSSPPPQSSPKLPIRRKNNKKAAPTPPDNRAQRASEYYGNMNSASHNENMQAMKERFLNSTPQDDSKLNSHRFLRNETKAQQTFKQPAQPLSMKQCSSSTENLSTTKPDKPPRPAMPVIDSQTLVRNAFKSKANERHSRPIALPRNILNVARSTENLCSSSTSPIKISPNAQFGDENDPIQLRDQSDHIRGDKPAIPERPTSLMKINFRTAVFDKFDSQQQSPNESGIKKTQSFRMSSSPGGSAGSITGRSLTTLERTHIYNVDKKQVEIVDVDQQSNSNSSTDSSNGELPNENGDKMKSIEKCDEQVLKTKDDTKPNESNENNLNVSNNTMSISTTSTECPVPQSPRCFEPKIIKRPQVPAPLPPTVHANSEANCENRKPDQTANPATTAAADSTKL